MRYKIWISLLLLAVSPLLLAQQADRKPIRIVDTLTIKEKAERNPVILRSELDSMIKQYIASLPPVKVQEPVKEKTNDTPVYLLGALLVVIILLGWLIYLFYRHLRKSDRNVAELNKQVKYLELYSGAPLVKEFSNTGKEKGSKNKTSAQLLENKINDLNAELHKLSKENEGLNRVIKEYNGIQHEYDSLKHGMSKAYKVKNYPGYDKDKAEPSAFQGVLETENSVANYAYEKFLKPILSITDSNKNNPAKINADDRRKLLDLLVSLSLLYIEYLYLRVQDLAIGGKMVERLQAFSNGKGLDPALLKKLNTEFGSRALVLRMALDKAELHQLSYPVFDETNLNNQ